MLHAIIISKQQGTKNYETLQRLPDCRVFYIRKVNCWSWEPTIVVIDTERKKNYERIIKNLKTYNLNFPLYRYRMHNSNKTKQKDYKDLYLDKINKIKFKENFNKFKKNQRI